MRRRNVLFTIVAWMLSGVRVLFVRIPFTWSDRARADATTPGAAQKVTSSQQLLQELARLDKRNYAEEGIPMLLACENLSREDQQPGPVQPIASNAELASLFRSYAEALPRVRPEASESDVAKLVELVADHDFSVGGIRRPQ